LSAIQPETAQPASQTSRQPASGTQRLGHDLLKNLEGGERRGKMRNSFQKNSRGEGFLGEGRFGDLFSKGIAMGGEFPERGRGWGMIFDQHG